MNKPEFTMAGKPDVTGGIAVAPLTTARPLDAITPLPVAWEKLGLVNQDGVSRTIDRTTTPWVDWEGNEYRVISSEHSVTYNFVLTEVANPVVLRTLFGADNVTVDAETGLITVKVNARMAPLTSLILLVKDEDGEVRRAWREYIPRAQVINAANEVTFNAGDPISFPVEVKALVDSAGNKAYSMIEPLPDPEA